MAGRRRSFPPWSRPRVPEEGLLVSGHTSESPCQYAISRSEVFSLIVLYMANDAEQAQDRLGEQGISLARLSRLGARLRQGPGPLPPVFDCCRAVISPEEEQKPRERYAQGLNL